MTDSLTTKFKRPDQIGGLILIGLALAALGYGFWIVLPTLIQFAQDTLYLGAMVAVGAVLAMFLLDRKFWHAIYFATQNMIRSLRRRIVREDPIGVLDTVIARFETKLVEVSGYMVDADVARRKQAKSIKVMLDRAENERLLCQTAITNVRSEAEIQQHAAAAERWLKAADSEKPMAEFLDKMKAGMEQARELCESKLADRKSQREVLAIKLETAQSTTGAVKGFKRFFGSNPDLELESMAIDEIENDSLRAESEIDDFMQKVTPMLKGEDLQRKANAAAALQKLGAFVGKVPALPSAVIDGVVTPVVQEKVKS